MQRKDKKGKDVWVPVDVDIDAHIIEPTIDTSVPRFLENYITDLSIAPPLDITRPMWQCHILNGPSSNGSITDGWDGAEDLSAPLVTNFVNFSPCRESQRTWMDCLRPPAAMIPMSPSPSNFERDAAHALLEKQESVGGEWRSG